MEKQSTEKEILKSFIELTKCSESKAKNYLLDNQWNINYALNDFYDKELGSFVEDSRENVYPEDLVDLFNKYADKESHVITFEGMIQFIGDLGLAVEDDLITIILAKLLSWKRMTDPIELEQFCSTWFMQGCSCLQDMKLLLQELDHKLYHDPTYFAEVYHYTFALLLDDQKNQLDVTTATEYWKLFLLTPKEKVPIVFDLQMVSLWLQFLQDEKHTTITADCWKMVLQFFQQFPSFDSLSKDYNEVDPWPYIIDEYYEYLQDLHRI